MNERTSVALGSFDGLHRGHQAVLQNALSFSDGGLLPCVLLFDRHPLSVLRGAAPPALLDNALRDRLLMQMGFSIETADFARIRDLTPENFVRQILMEKLHAGAVSCGFNYRFGRNGAGDVQTLERLCRQYGIRLRVAEPVLEEGAPISSTRIRACLRTGDIERVTAMLSRPFCIAGTVVHGNANGRLWGYPTANFPYPTALAKPRRGVYASDVRLGGEGYRAITNIGVRPTLQGTALGVETHILGMERDLYGEEMTVFLRRFIRPEQKFDTLEDVFRQVRQDIRTAYPTEKDGEQK